MFVCIFALSGPIHVHIYIYINICTQYITLSSKCNNHIRFFQTRLMHKQASGAPFSSKLGSGVGFLEIVVLPDPFRYGTRSAWNYGHWDQGYGMKSDPKPELKQRTRVDLRRKCRRGHLRNR